MTYTIRITNKNTVPGVANVNTLYLDTISPSLVTDLKSTYEAFIADMEVTDTSIYVPLYKRLQVVKVPASSVLVITTEDSSEATYYRLLKLNNSFILINPDPITSAYVDPVLIEKTITENGIYLASQDDADGYSLVDVNVPNSYSAEDDGKVVSNGALVSQSTHKPITTNGTGIDTTTYSSVDVDVPNTYSVGDNGKVVSNQALVSQTAYPTTITQNDTYDTTNYNSVTVNVSGGGGSGATFIDSGEFSLKHSLTSITIPSGVTSIGSNAFEEYTSLETVSFESPSSLEYIYGNAFDTCSALTSITIPSGVTSIGSSLFDGCSSLTSITFEPTTPPDLDGDLGIETNCTIRVPQGTLFDYTSAENYPDLNEYTYVEY